MGTQQVTVTITDDDPTPTVTLAVDNASIDEAAGVVTIPRPFRPRRAGHHVESRFQRTATETDDYTASATQIVIPAGATSGSITITAVDDLLDEADETVIVDTGSEQATVTISDNDLPPTVSLAGIGQRQPGRERWNGHGDGHSFGSCAVDKRSRWPYRGPPSTAPITPFRAPRS